MRWVELVVVWGYTRTLSLLARSVFVGIPREHLEQHRAPSVEFRPGTGVVLDPKRAEFLWTEQEAASAHTDEMTKQLLTLSFALVTVFITLLPWALLALRFAAIAALLVSVVFCLQGFGVRRKSVPDTPYAMGEVGDREWTNDLITATGYNRGSHFHRVDLYRAAKRWFMLALMLVVLAAILRPAALPRADTLEALPNPGLTKARSRSVAMAPSVRAARDTASGREDPRRSESTRVTLRSDSTEALVTRLLPSLVGALIGGLIAVFGAMKAQEHRARIENRRAYRQLRNILMDEVFTLAMRCSAWSTFIRDTKRLTDFHVYQLQVRMEVYDRSIERLALFPLEVRRSTASWYQQLKAALWFASDLEKRQTYRLENEARQSVAIEQLEGERIELMNRLDRLAKDGDELFKALVAAPDDLPKEEVTSPLRRGPPKPPVPAEDSR